MKASFCFIFSILVTVSLALLSGCKTVKTEYVPVQSVRVEYRDKLIKDSVYVLDSIFSYSKNDTVFNNKYRYFTRNYYLKDTINVRDTIRVPYPVEKTVITNVLKSWQKWCIWYTLATIVALLLYLGFKYKSIIFNIIKKLIAKS